MCCLASDGTQLSKVTCLSSEVIVLRKSRDDELRGSNGSNE
jgi:hypothetical protein